MGVSNKHCLLTFFSFFFQKQDTDSENESSSASVESKVSSDGNRGTKRSHPMIDSTNKQLKPS